MHRILIEQYIIDIIIIALDDAASPLIPCRNGGEAGKVGTIEQSVSYKNVNGSKAPPSWERLKPYSRSDHPLQLMV